MTAPKAWIDDRGRPIVAITHSASNDPLICLIDTGFHASLLIDFNTARALGVRTDGTPMDDNVVGGKQTVTVAKLMIQWPGLHGPASVRVLPPGVALFPTQMTWPGTDPEPEALIGRELLALTDLHIDFCASRVGMTPCP